MLYYLYCLYPIDCDFFCLDNMHDKLLMLSNLEWILPDRSVFSMDYFPISGFIYL